MIYRKIRASWKDDREMLYRVFLIDESMSVLEFTVVLQKLFHMEFSHLFQIMFSKRYYQPAKFNEYDTGNIDSLAWDDLPRKFVFEYDFGESWEFEIFVFKKPVEINDSRRVILLEGSGAGIWEDERSAMTLYKNEGELPPYEQYEDFMPWNLEYLKDLDSTLDFMHEQEQDRIDGFMNGEFSKVMAQLDTFMSVDDDWEEYNEEIEALRRNPHDDDDALAGAVSAIEAFFRALESLSRQDLLPACLEDLQNIENGPEDCTGIYQDVPDVLVAQGKYRFCLMNMKKLQFFFPKDEETKLNTDGIILSCLCGLKRFDQAHKLLDEYDQILDDPQAKAVNRARVYMAEGKLAEAEKLLAPYINKDIEANEDNYPLLIAAYQLYSRTDPEKADAILEKIDAIEETLFPEENESAFTEANEELCFAAQRFREHQSQYRYSIGAAVFIMLCQDRGNVLLPLDTNLNPLVHTTEDGRVYAVVCSCPEAADELGYYDEGPTAVSDIVKSVLDSGLDGILVDPDEYGNGLFIHAQTLEDMIKVMNEEDPGEKPLFLS